MRWKKSLLVLSSLWSDDIIKGLQRFFKTVIMEELTKKVVHFDQLRHRPKTGVNRRLLTDFFEPAT